MASIQSTNNTDITFSNNQYNLDCYMLIIYGGYDSETVHLMLPCYPDELRDSTSANWSQITILGRSSPLATYTGTGFRGVSFSFTLHREMTENDQEIENILQALRKTVYPEYATTGLKIPITQFVFGNFKVKGMVKSVDFTWKKPIIKDTYQLCDVSISIDETTSNVFSASQLGKSQNPFQ